jgi:hypothetical protein
MITLAKKFAELLDNNRFDDAVELMAEDCQYHYFEGDYSGKSNIMAIYRSNHKESGKLFDEVLYSSEVVPLSDNSFNILFSDKIRIANKWHTYRCFQILRFENDLIADINHHEMPGETEAMREFYQRMKAREKITLP